MKPIKFIDAFIAALTIGMRHASSPQGHGARTPGRRNPPGTKLARLARSNALTLRGRAGKLS